MQLILSAMQLGSYLYGAMGGGALTPLSGYVFLVDSQGNYLVDRQGNYLIAAA